MIKPKLKLVGQDGNAFMIIGLARRAAVRANWSKCDWDAFLKQAQGGDYDNLLKVVMEHFDVI